jgi:hypothetical protein
LIFRAPAVCFCTLVAILDPPITYFLWMNNIPLCTCAIFLLYDYWLLGIWADSITWLLYIVL